MLALAHHTKRHAFALTGRSVLAVVIAITALANIIAVVREFPWNSLVVTEPLMDLGGPAWERDGLIVTGALLLLIARALIRGKRQAWWLAVGLLAFSLTSALGSHSDRGTILMALGLLLLLLLLAPLFPTRSDTRALVRGYAALLLGLGCLAAHMVVSQLWQTAGDQGALALRNGSLFLLHLLTFLALGYGVVKVLRPVRFARPRLGQEHARVYKVVRRYGSLATVHFALGKDKSYFWSETGRAVIAYRVVHGVALALGDPIGPQEEDAPLLQAFLAFCRRQDWSVALYQASAQTHHLCQEWGLHTYKIGEDALIDAAHFTLQGKRGAPVRHAVARARRAGLSAQCWQGETLPEAVFAGMQRISAQWLDTRKIQTQMGFSMGRFPADWSKDLLTVVAFDSEGQVQAFLTWTPLYAGNGWALDAMRRGEETPPGAMELLIAFAIEWAQAHGYTRMSLGLAPLAGLDGEMSATTCDAIEPGLHAPSSSLLERCAASLHRRGIVLGAYRSLYAFKAKFQPTWEARYLIVSEGQALPRILLALARVHGCGWWSMLQEAWGTARPLNTMMKAVAKLLHARWPPMEREQTEGQRRNSCEHQPVGCKAE
jgi:phosphatidylglycerol lysyltransferase